MKIFLFICFVIIVFGIYNVLGLTKSQISKDIMSLVGKQQTISKRALIAQGKKKESRLKKAIDDIQFALKITKKQDMFAFICIASILLFLFGIVCACLIGNYLLMPVFAFAFSSVPYIYTKSILKSFNKQVRTELETALSVITSSYIRTEDLTSAISENVDNLKQPVKDIFKEFLGHTKLINSNMSIAIERLKTKIDHPVFEQWCDILIACQEDRTLKQTLLPVAEKMTDLRIVNAKLEVKVQTPKREFITILALVYMFIPMLYFLNKEWFHILLFSLQGKISLTITVLMTAISIVKVVKYTKPIEYK